MASSHQVPPSDVEREISWKPGLHPVEMKPEGVNLWLIGIIPVSLRLLFR
jgi:hypothetical protein